MSFKEPTRKHNYRYNPTVVVKVSKETMDEHGNIGISHELVDLCSPDLINTPDRSVMDMEVLQNSGQSISRVNTCVMDSSSFDDLPDVPIEKQDNIED